MSLSARKGYYSIIQYCPDLCRTEAANIGVVLLCPAPHFMGTRMAPHNERALRFFGSENGDLDCLNYAKEAILSRLSDTTEFRTVADLQHFTATRANEIQMTPPRPCKVFDPPTELDQLYRELVDAGTQGGMRPSSGL